jgi:hypothetical protein
MKRTIGEDEAVAAGAVVPEAARRLESSWQPTCNAGANPVPIRLRTAAIAKPVVQELLRATFQIPGSGAAPWSGRHAQPEADATEADARNP